MTRLMTIPRTAALVITVSVGSVAAPPGCYDCRIQEGGNCPECYAVACIPGPNGTEDCGMAGSECTAICGGTENKCIIYVGCHMQLQFRAMDADYPEIPRRAVGLAFAVDQRAAIPLRDIREGKLGALTRGYGTFAYAYSNGRNQPLSYYLVDSYKDMITGVSTVKVTAQTDGSGIEVRVRDGQVVAFRVLDSSNSR